MIRRHNVSHEKHTYTIMQDLQIKRVGNGYTIRFVAMLPNGIPFAFLDCSDIGVLPGEPYMLKLLDSMGPAVGGSPFPVQPRLRVVDRGGNAVFGISPSRRFRPSVTVTLDESPEGSNGSLQPSAAVTAPIIDGFVRFEGLYINEAGEPYRLKFTSNLVYKMQYIIFTYFFNLTHSYLYCICNIRIYPTITSYIRRISLSPSVPHTNCASSAE